MLTRIDRLQGQLDQAVRIREDCERRMGELEARIADAARVQRALLPSDLPHVDGIQVELLYRPIEGVSGDCYNAFRLDGTHVAFSLSDATGHGLSAGLLSTLVQQSVHGWSAVPWAEADPANVLQAASQAIAALKLEDCPFVAALFAVYDESTRRIRWARGGFPYPVLMRSCARPIHVLSDGPLLGVKERAKFETVDLPLDPGDTLIFYTDGIERALGPPGRQRTANPGMAGAPPPPLTDMTVPAALARVGLAESGSRLDGLARLVELSQRMDGQADDATAFALHVQDNRPVSTNLMDDRLIPASV